MIEEQGGQVNDFFREVVQSTRLLGDASERARCWMQLLATSPEAADTVLGDFLRDVDLVQHQDSREAAYADAAKNLMKVGRLAEARQMYGHVEDSTKREECVTREGVLLAELGRVEEARAILAKLPEARSAARSFLRSSRPNIAKDH